MRDFPLVSPLEDVNIEASNKGNNVYSIRELISLKENTKSCPTLIDWLKMPKVRTYLFSFFFKNNNN